MAVAVVFGFWYLLSFLFKTPILPYPHTVFSTLPLSMERGLGNHFGVSGYRILLSLSWALITAVPSFATENGLGFFILDAWSTLDYLSMYTGIMGMGVLGVILYEGVDRIERRYCRWMFSA